MSINKYLLELETVINSFPFIAAYNLNIDRKTDDIAFISGRIEFKNGSVLDFKEFIESINDKIEKYKYAYNFRTSSDHIFRYDNALDPGAKKLKTFPHHKHLKSGEIIESRLVELVNILEEIERIYVSETSHIKNND